MLSSLCEASNVEAAARQLLSDYPKVVRAFPSLLAWRGPLSLLEDSATGAIETFDFAPKERLSEEEIARYVRFLGASGVLELLCNIKSVPDYATGVEVGMDTNGRKGRSGKLAIRALRPHIDAALQKLEGVEFWEERTYPWLRERGCPLSPSMALWKWDGAFFSAQSGRWVLLEVNHYSTTGSKPTAITGDYTARELELNALGVGFIWVTDGLGWRQMQRPLKHAFQELRFLSSIALARDGLLEWALRSMLSAK